MSFKPCRVSNCPALASPKSIIFGYCPIHHSIATDAVMFDDALKGKLTAGMKAFAEDINRGLYPKQVW